MLSFRESRRAIGDYQAGTSDPSYSSESNTLLRDTSDSRPTFFIPGINGKARCLLAGDSCLQLELEESHGSLLCTEPKDKDRDKEKKKKKKSSDPDKRKKKRPSSKMKSFHQSTASESRRSLDDSEVVHQFFIARSRQESFLRFAEKERLLLFPHACVPRVDVQDIGCQSEEVMGSLMMSKRCHNSTENISNRLRFLEAERSGRKTPSGSLAQNLHDSILQRYTCAHPTPRQNSLYSTSSYMTEGSNHVPGMASHDAVATRDSPREHKKIASLLCNNIESPCSLDIEDLAAAQQDTPGGPRTMGPMERLYTSMSEMGHDWAKDDDEFNERLERLHSSGPLNLREKQKLGKKISDLPPIPLFGMSSDEKKKKKKSSRHESGDIERKSRHKSSRRKSTALEELQEGESEPHRRRHHRHESSRRASAEGWAIHKA